MAHKTFISYKYSEAQDLRNDIINKLGADATYYRGETSNSPDLTDRTTETIRKNLSDMIYDTSVMIVIISPNMLQSKWMEWEIKYALREQSRNGRTSHANGVICVVQKQKNSFYNFYSYDAYAWAKYNGTWSPWKLFDVIKNNQNNKKSYAFNSLPSNYIDIVTEDTFLKNPFKYIDEAYNKSQNSDCYNISKQGGMWQW